MSKKYVRLSLIIDQESDDNAKWLKKYCHINISSFVRESIQNKFKEMKKVYKNKDEKES